MRNRQTFLLTVLTPENGSASHCGKVRIISTGKTCTFTSFEELYLILSLEMGEEYVQRLAPVIKPRASAEDAPLSA